VLIVAFGAKPVYHWLKARRAEQFATAGDALTQAGKWDDAAQKFAPRCNWIRSVTED